MEKGYGGRMDILKDLKDAFVITFTLMLIPILAIIAILDIIISGKSSFLLELKQPIFRDLK